MLRTCQPLLAVLAVVVIAALACGEPPPGATGGSDNGANDVEPPDQSTCEGLCDQMYNDCEMSLTHDDGSTASEAQCVDQCLDEIFEGQEQCLLDAGCDEAQFNDCLAGGGNNSNANSNNAENSNNVDPPEFENDLEDVCGDWPAEWAQFEADVLQLTNQRREEGAECDDTPMDPVEPLDSNDTLQCAARLHSLDMVERDYFDHYTPEGDSPGDRAAELGYPNASVGENIAMGQPTPEDVVQGWMNSPGHCQNIMSAQYNELGVGYARDDQQSSFPLWTQKFGTR